MKVFPLITVALLQSIPVSCSVMPADQLLSAITPKQIGDLLGPLLSETASIFLPDADNWANLIKRAGYPRINPVYKATVEVATEKDVENTIKFANKHGLPFLTVTGTHGWPCTLNRASGGIQIRMRKMNHAKLSDDGKSVHAGGGIMQYEITEALYAHKKAAVTGLCECVSAIGPLLGGGHSMLQSKGGFAADNLISARVVLADGKAVTASETENPDLFWALRGAGHNFGVVTSMELRVFDVKKKWTMVIFSYTQDKLEKFFKTWNKLEAKYAEPGMLILNGVMNRNTDVDPDHATVNVQVIWEGNNEFAGPYVSAFKELDPAFNQTVEDIEYGNIYDIGGFGTTSSVCRKNNNILGYPSSFTKWDPQAMRKGFDLFDELTSDETFSTSAWLLESYGRGEVQKVPISSNAVAPEERENHLLTSPMLWWAGDDAANQAKAEKYGSAMRKAVRSGVVTNHAYVNYAMGEEDLNEMYGHSDARINKLQGLKSKWDPKNKFGFYNPI